MDAVKLGSFLRTLRKEHGLTQEQLAEKLGVTNRTVSRWETGTNMPDLDILIELSQFYQIDIKKLLNGERKMAEAKVEPSKMEETEEINLGKTDAEDTEILQQVAEYCTLKEENIMCKIFSTAVSGVVAVGGLFYTTLRFFNDVTSSCFVSLLLVIAFLIYNITMQAFRGNRSAVGYRFTLTGGFIATIISNITITWLFFGSGSYHNYGLLGFYYMIAIVIITFVAVGIITKILIKRQSH